jgi:hypothetical protein
MKRFRRFFLSGIILILLYTLWGAILIHKNQTQSLIQKTSTIIQNRLTVNPCSQPKTFAIGSIDPRFNINKEELVELSKQAADIWNKVAGKTILQYDNNSSFKINLIFDQRQSQTLAKENLEKKLKSLALNNDELTKQYAKLHSNYQQQINQYKKKLKKYKNRLDDYNQEVSYWNDKGGAPKDEYKKLKKEKEDLQDEYAELEKKRKKVNQLSEKTNLLVTQENQLVKQYNNQWTTYKSEFGVSKEFEKGVFNTKEINIYQFQKKSDLLLTLAHELGHYLGMQHVQNSQSIMYYLLSNQNLDNPLPTVQDKEELKKVCNL